MADGRHFAKSVKSPYLCNLLTDFDEFWQDDDHCPLTAEQKSKIQDQNPQKSLKGDITQHHVDFQAM